MSDAHSSSSEGSETGDSVDRFEDVFVHHIAEIEQVWKQLNVARAMNEKVHRSNTDPGHFKMHYPLPLSAIQQIANHELQEMRENDEGDEGEVAESIEKEAGVLLSFLGAMFVENLMVKTMYHLPQRHAFGFEQESVPTPVDENASSSAPTLDSTAIFASNTRLKPVGLVISREDVRRALLRDEQFDFLVQSGHAQPDLNSAASIIEEGDGSSNRSSETDSETIHMGYWKIIERTFSALELGSSSKETQFTTTNSHNPADLKSKVMMSLTPESDPSHARFTLFPENEDLDSNSVEFVLTKTGQDQRITKARINGRAKLGHVIISSLEGLNVDLFANISDDDDTQPASRALPPMNFSWKSQNEEDPNFPLAGRPIAAGGYGSVQLLDSSSASDMFGSAWLNQCSWGVMSLDLVFSLGDTGFNLHNHYLAIPIFVQPPAEH